MRLTVLLLAFLTFECKLIRNKKFISKNHKKSLSTYFSLEELEKIFKFRIQEKGIRDI